MERSESKIEKPIYLIGMPRSGTTVIFDILAVHPDVAWFSQYNDRFPRLPILSLLSRLAQLNTAFRKSIERSDQRRDWIERFRIGPVEAYKLYEHCCGPKFLYDFLLGVTATKDERDCLRQAVLGCLRYQGKKRFISKITGPGRIGYLTSVFGDALFVNLIRDGRAVVHSLMKAPFWRNSFRMSKPSWQNGLSEEDLEQWRRHDFSPVALAAIQWRACIVHTRKEAKALSSKRYIEIRYEGFVRNPHEATDEVLLFCGLPVVSKVHDFMNRRFELRDMNFQWREQFTQHEIRMLEEILSDDLVPE